MPAMRNSNPQRRRHGPPAEVDDSVKERWKYTGVYIWTYHGGAPSGYEQSSFDDRYYRFERDDGDGTSTRCLILISDFWRSCRDGHSLGCQL